MAAAADEAWCRETFPQVMELVSPRLPQRDACALLSISPWCHRALTANPKLWEVRIAPRVLSPSTALSQEFITSHLPFRCVRNPIPGRKIPLAVA
jgi:F-box/leucine-rich repeat protein 2/20